MSQYTIKIDETKCIAAASCVGVAMKTFQLNNQNKATVIDPVGDDPEMQLLAAQSCPTKAIIIINNETNEQIWPKK